MHPSIETPDPRDDPRWYQRAIIYQTHVRAFYDSNRDGVGDFNGLTEKLDYVRDLGADCLWLLPFYPSPLRDGGYDIADYTSVNPVYGTIDDFRRLVREAHRRGLRVMTELVLNHTSDQHPWFRRAREAPPGSPEREFYVWSDTTDRYRDARVIFKDFVTSNWSWDPVAKQYYWHRFYPHQPDLNWDNPEVERELLAVIDFWFETGVDGLRLDAVPYLYEREGTTCENLEETHGALKRIRRYMDAKYPGRALLAEANQWPEDAVAYFGDADECHMAFHFPLMPRLYMSMETEDRFPLVDILEQTPPIPSGCQWTIFLRNHDELTLEMVSDEERDYMLRAFAGDPRARINLGIRRRLAPLLGSNRRKIELLNGLLFSFHGTPVIYYGDEIGMGDNIYLGDRDGCRTPMQWSADRNAGFSAANPQQLYLPVNIDPEYRYEAVNVEAQQRNINSLWWWMRRAIALRKRYVVLGEGALEFLHPRNPKILAFLRRSDTQQMLVVANLSRSVQYAELDLHAFEGRVPLEVFGRTRFPRVGQLPYLLTLAPHGFYWLDLSERRDMNGGAGLPLPTVEHHGDPSELFLGRGRRALERVLPEVLLRRRWFGGKARGLDEVHVLDVLPVPVTGMEESRAPRLLVLQVTYETSEDETYAVPVALAEGSEARRMLDERAWALLAQGEAAPGREPWVLYDALELAPFRAALLDVMRGRREARGEGTLRGAQTVALAALEERLGASPESTPLNAEQSNSSLVFDELVMLKLFRRLDRGVNPDFEIGRHLTQHSTFEGIPAVLGAIEYAGVADEAITLAVGHRFIPNQGDGWRYTTTELGLYMERVLGGGPGFLDDKPSPEAARGPERAEARARAEAAIGGYVHLIARLGARTAELHAALARPSSDASFDPEPFTPYYQRGLYQSMRSLTARSLDLLQKKLTGYDEVVRAQARLVLERRHQLFRRFELALKGEVIDGKRIRIHGDFHLGQVLFTGKDWVIIDFEGEPARSLGDRRIKRSPLRDVAGLLRSLDYARHEAVRHQVATGGVDTPSDTHALLERAARYWRQWVESYFLEGYFEVAEREGYLPRRESDRRRLLDAYLLEKAIYELGYELDNRPAMVGLPVAGILGLLGEGAR